MTDDAGARRHQRLRALLEEAASLTPPERERLLARVRAEDASLAVDLERLLDDSWVRTDRITPDPATALDTTRLAPGTVVGPYRIERELGSGGMGTVYAARDVARAIRVALKAIHPHLASRPGARERFAREAELGRRVHHPRVVRTLGSGRAEVDGRPVDFVVLEYVRGRDLATLRRERGPLSPALLREVGAQAADGLAAIHAAGIVHRDIKPENLLITEDHELRIMDLGIARPLHTEMATLTQEGQFVGSLAFAAPEQIAGEEATPQSDLYALGATLRDLARADARPGGGNLAAVLRGGKPPGSTTTAEVGPFLAAVLERLLDADPKRRFASAAELRDVLLAGEAGPWWRERATREGRLPRARVPVARDVPFHGRRAAADALAAAWREVRDRKDARVVDVEGEDGGGKSRLVAEFLDGLPAESATFYGACTRGGFVGGVRGALAAAYADADAERRIAAQLDSPPHAVASFLAWLRGDATPESAGVSVAGLAARLLGSLARDLPATFVVDDLDEASREERRLLDALVAGVRGRPVLIVRLAGPSLAAGTVVAPDATLRLEPLAEADAIALVRDAAPAAALDEGDVERIAKRGEGLPLFLVELARGAHAPAPAAGVDLPDALAEHVRRRLRDLPDEESELLAVAAVEGPVFEVDPLVLVRGATRLRVLEILDRLERRRRLVRADGAVWRFEHRIAQEVVYAGIAPVLRAEIHRALGDAALSTGTTDPTALRGAAAVRYVRHHRNGPDPSRVAACVIAAATHLESQGRGETAADWLEQALDGDALAPVQRVAARSMLSRLRRFAGRAEDAERHARRGLYEAAQAGTSDIAPRVEFAYTMLDLGRYADATEHLALALDALPESGEEVRRGGILGGLGQAAWHRGDYAEARRRQEQVIALGRASGNASVESRGAGDLAVLLQELGHHDEAEAMTRRALALQMETGDYRNYALTLCNLGNVLYDAGRLGEAVVCYRQSREDCRALGMRVNGAVAELNLAESLRRLGQFEEAEACLDRARATFAAGGLLREEAFALHSRGILAMWQSEFAAARVAFEAALDRRRRLSDARGMGDTLQAIAALDLVEGDREAAVARIAEARGACAPGIDVTFDALVAARAALAGCGSVDDALAACAAAGARLRHDARIEILDTLIRATDAPALRDEARSLLEAEAARLAPEDALRFRTAVPLHRALLGHVAAS